MKPAIKDVLKFLVLAIIPILIIWKLTSGGDMNTAETAQKINASHLYRSYYDNAALANQTFENKVIEVSGAVASVDQTKEGNIQIALETKNQMGQIVCTLESKNPSQLGTLRIGQSLTIKGICKGYFKDVIITNGLIFSF